jgi:NADPH:quinone reductase-like Zn-dependent oxidoreductase
MKAIRVSEYGGPSVLKLEELPTPQPGPNQVLVRILAVGVNPVDTICARTRTIGDPSCPTRQALTQPALSRLSVRV